MPAPAPETGPPPARTTKIVCTIGPASSSEPVLRALIQAGMNVARLNFSHGTHEEHGRRIALIRRLAREHDAPVAILQDLAGPKVRVGTFAEDAVELRPGEAFTLTTRPVTGTSTEVSVSYAQLPEEVAPDHMLLLADGSIQLRVETVGAQDIGCRVVVGGTLSNHKGVNVPSGLRRVPILDDKDRADLRFGVEQGVDFIGVSFVRTADDVETAAREIAACGATTPIIAKIETEAALVNFDAILDACDGIMIARGDLSIETPYTQVPTVQKTLIAKANRQTRHVITATQMLYSMVVAPQPTRAEVADVANAVMDGSDAVMLSEETAVGRHPVAAVRTMADIACATERGHEPRRPPPPDAGDAAGSLFASGTEALALAACQLAPRLGAEVIATLTESGRTARMVAKYRPRQPVLALTRESPTYRRLALVRGVTPLLVEGDVEDAGDLVRTARAVARAAGWRGKAGIFVSNRFVRRGVL